MKKVCWPVIGTTLILVAVSLAACAAPGATAPTEQVTTEPPDVTEQSQPTPTEEVVVSPSDVAAASDFAALTNALTAAGASVHLMDPLVGTTFAGQALGFNVNGENLQAIQYESADALEADLATILANPPADWGADAHIWKSGTVAVLYLGTNEELVTLLNQVAGPQVIAGHGNPDVAMISDFASLQAALTALGADVKLGDPTVGSMFAGRGYSFAVNGEGVQVFEYDSPDAMEADAAKLSPDASTFDGGTVDWGPTPVHFWKSGNIIVVYGGMNADLVTLVTSAMGEPFASSGG